MENINYGQRIKSFRKASNLTPKELAELANLDITTIYKIESNYAKPSIDSLERICSILNISLSAFFSVASNHADSVSPHIQSMLADPDFQKVLLAYTDSPLHRSVINDVASSSPQTALLVASFLEEKKTKI